MKRVHLAQPVAPIEVYEYMGPEILHAKNLVVDGRYSLIGSYNFDERSDHLNLELSIQFDDPQVAKQISGSILVRMQKSPQISPARHLPEVGGQASAWKRIRMRLNQATTPIYRRSL